MEAFTFPLDRVDIEKLIPHRDPMLMLDKISKYQPGQYLVAEKTFLADDPIAKSHFPGRPIFPGVLMIEAMAQASAIFGALEMDGFEECFLAQVSSARFRQPVIPNDTMIFKVDFQKRRQNFSWFSGHATVGSKTIAEVEFSALIR